MCKKKYLYPIRFSVKNYIYKFYGMKQFTPVSKKSWPILYNKLLHKMGQDFLDKPYAVKNLLYR